MKASIVIKKITISLKCYRTGKLIHQIPMDRPIEPQLENDLIQQYEINEHQQQNESNNTDTDQQHDLFQRILIQHQFHPYYCSPARYKNYRTVKNEKLFLHCSFTLPAHVDGSSTNQKDKSFCLDCLCCNSMYKWIHTHI
jgi:hypothetical protein